MVSAPRRSSADLSQEIERALRLGPRTSVELQDALGVSQPTLSRTIRQLVTVTMFRVSGDRTPRYALLRSLPLGLNSRQKIYRHLRTGHIAPFADVEFLVGGATLERIGGIARMYDGLPPYMLFAAPSGFLGRQLAPWTMSFSARAIHGPSSPRGASTPGISPPRMLATWTSWPPSASS